MKLPALMDAVIPPCVFESGCPKYSRYCSLPIQADMLLTSNPNRAPPMVPLNKKVSKLWNHTREYMLMEKGGAGGGGRVVPLQAGEDVDIPDSIHGCCCLMKSGQQGRSGLFRDRSVGGQLEIRMVLQTGGCSKYLLSATESAATPYRTARSQEQRHARFDARPAAPGAAMTVNVEWPGMLLPMANHTQLEPTQSLDGCHRQGLLLVTARRGRQTTLCHGLAETDISPRGSGSEDLGHGWGRDSGDTGEALSTLEKDRCCPALRSTVNVMSQWD